MLIYHANRFSFWTNLFTVTNTATKLGHVRLNVNEQFLLAIEEVLQSAL